MTYPTLRLSHLASTRTSNVDKKSYVGEVIVRLCNYTDVYKNDLITADMDFMVATATRDQIGKFGLKVGDTVFTKDSETPDDIGIPAYVGESARDLVCGYHLAIARPLAATTDPRFLYWFLASPEAAQQWSVLASGVTRVGIRQADIGRLEIPAPPLQTQLEIAVFLDRETAQIDDLIGKQERLIELLAEKRQAVITHAVTKGLDPTAPTKPSGLPWLEDLPIHWTRSRLKWTNPAQESGTSVNGADVPAGSDEFGVLKTGAVSKGYFVPEANKSVVPEDIGRLTCPVRGGTLIVNRANTPDLVGSTCRTTDDAPSLFLSDKLWQIDFERADTNFVYWWSKTEVYRSQIEFRRVGASSSMQNLSYPDFLTVDIALPPFEEQTIIAMYLDDRTAAIDLLKVKAQQSVSLLRERRSSLVSAAVTGKINVGSI